MKISLRWPFSVSRDEPQQIETPAPLEQTPAEQPADAANTDMMPLAIEMGMIASGGWVQGGSFTQGFDGEMTLGGMGAPKTYVVNYQMLRIRARQMYLESDVVRNAVNRRKIWVIGKGLKLQCEPNTKVLESYGITLDAEKFNEKVEGWWKAYQSSKAADYAGMRTLAQLTDEAFKEMDVAGGLLVVLRVINGVVKVQHIDIARVCTPYYFPMDEDRGEYQAGYDYKNPDNGNRVRNGVEIDDAGRHIAYWVVTGVGLTYDRIEARGPMTGLVYAYVVYRELNGVEDVTGVGKFVSTMEAASMLQRYNTAALAGEEERVKIPYFFEHGNSSKQIDPMLALRARANAGNAGVEGFGNAAVGLPTTASAEQLANKVAATTDKMVFNLPNDVSIKAIQSDQNSKFNEFANFQTDKIANGADMPPNVLTSKYDGSFSSSRMSGKDWEHTFSYLRFDMGQQYMAPIYCLQVYILVLQNYVDAPGFVRAIQNRNEILCAAYLQCRWEGDKFPDVDQLKTAKYLREMLGDQFKHVPLMTMEAAAEEAGQGDYNSIIEQIAKEKEKVEGVGLVHESKVPPQQGGTKPPEDEDEEDVEEDEEEDEDEDKDEDKDEDEED
jgi:capsid protein